MEARPAERHGSDACHEAILPRCPGLWHDGACLGGGSAAGAEVLAPAPGPRRAGRCRDRLHGGELPSSGGPSARCGRTRFLPAFVGEPGQDRQWRPMAPQLTRRRMPSFRAPVPAPHLLHRLYIARPADSMPRADVGIAVGPGPARHHRPQAGTSAAATGVARVRAKPIIG